MLDEEQTGLTQPPQQQSAVPEEQPEPSLESAASVESTASIPTESVPTAAAEQSAESEQPAAEAYPSFSEEADSISHGGTRQKVWLWHAAAAMAAVFATACKLWYRRICHTVWRHFRLFYARDVASASEEAKVAKGHSKTACSANYIGGLGICSLALLYGTGYLCVSNRTKRG